MGRRIVIAGVASGVGKTLVASAVSYGMRRRGYAVQPFKVGPDYIDPGYLSLAAGREARNLDSWLMGRSQLVESFASSAAGADVSVIEGVMGYYDGMSGRTNRSSTHEVACILGAPVILVVDVRSAARSVAAVVAGFARYQPNARIAGVILNRVKSARHARFCTDAIEQLRIPVLGLIPHSESYALESRHLGLVPPVESAAKRKRAMAAIAAAADHIDIDSIVRISRTAPKLKVRPRPRKSGRVRARVCVALDSSFNFYYRDNLDALEQNGAELEFFSPVSDRRLPECDAIYLGGGFPEVRASPLSRNSAMRNAIKKHATIDRRAIYAECGGMMYLSRAIKSGNRRHAMAGVLDAQTEMKKKMVLNYTRATVAKNCLVARRTKKLHGHEFHYSHLTGVGPDTEFAYRLDDGVGIRDESDGILQDGVLASYGHLYFGSAVADRIVDGICTAARR